MKVISDCGGTVTHALLHTNEDGPLQPTVAIIAALPQTQFTIAGTPAAIERARDGLGTQTTSQRIDWLVVPEPLSMWARDAFLVLAAADGSHRILENKPEEPNPGEPNPDALVPRPLGGRLQCEVVQAKIAFEGGNIVVSDEFAVAGWDLLADNIVEWTDAGLEAAHDRVEAQLGLPTLIVGAEDVYPPAEHIDMILTPLGGMRVLLGDPRLALGTLAALSPEALLEADTQFRSGPQESDDGLTELMELNAATDTLQSFDLICQQLTSAGCDVHRVPCLVTPSEYGQPMVSYNNVITEFGAVKPRVLLPQYGIDALDVSAVAVYESLGFEVTPIDMSSVRDLHGAVRCMVGVLTRDPVTRR
jgi:hypothetical protein